jgi:hypothetical protein
VPADVTHYELALNPVSYPRAARRHLRLRYEHLDVVGDGNCLFRALSVALFGTEAQHAAIRAQTCDFLKNNRTKYYDPFGELERYTETCDTPGKWGRHYDLAAIAQLYCARVVLHFLDDDTFGIADEVPNPTRVIWLGYITDEHYTAYRYTGFTAKSPSLYTTHSPPASHNSASSSSTARKLVDSMRDMGASMHDNEDALLF